MANETENKSGLRLSGIIGMLLCILFIPIIAVNLVLIISSYIYPDDLPGVFGIKPAVVLSGSMEPSIQVGDLIFIHDVDPAALKVGDVMCYLTDGKAVTHRIVEITTADDGTPRYVMQGDANNAADRLPVTASQVQGIWTGQRIAEIGNGILFMQTVPGMVIFILCPLLLFFVWDILQRRRQDKEEARRTAALEAELQALKQQADPNTADKA